MPDRNKTPKRPPTPPRPGPVPIPMTPDQPHPDGWGVIVCDDDGLVLCGWTDAGWFYAYAPTERIARACMDGLGLRDQLPPVRDA